MKEMGRAVEAGPIFVFFAIVWVHLCGFFSLLCGHPLRIAMNVKCRGDVGLIDFLEEDYILVGFSAANPVA